MNLLSLLFVATSPWLQETNASPFFPLAVGNRWFYEAVEPARPGHIKRSLLGYDFQKEVVAARILHGHEFYMVKNIYYNLNGTVSRSDSQLYAISVSKILTLNPRQQHDSSAIDIWVDFSFKPWQKRTWKSDNSTYEEYIRDSNESTVTFVKSSQLMDSGSEKTFKRGVGLTESRGYFLAVIYRLVNYEVR